MKLQLISFRAEVSGKERLESMLEIINHSNADLIVFCGHALRHYSYLVPLERGVKNKNVFVLFEVKRSYKEDYPNYLYTIQNGRVSSLNTKQMFSTSSEIENNESLCELYIDELETKRRFVVKDKRCLVIQCGENNIIKNRQSENNKPYFRFENRKDLKDRFFSLLKNTDIVLNPIHYPMGNQAKLKQRRLLFSRGKRCYFSVCNSIGKIAFNSKRIQYGYYNGKELGKVSLDTNAQYSIFTYMLL